MTLVFSLLGPVEITLDGAPLATGGPRGRRVLAALALEAGRVVPGAGLASAVWDDPPVTAREQLQNVAAALRRAGVPVARTDAGFALEADGAEMDVRSFVRLRRAAGACSGPAEARQLLGRALALWRGPVALGGLRGRVFEAASARLAEERLDCAERALAADLALGRHAEVCAELAQLSAEHPLREGLVELHMLALHRSGRRGEALAAYAVARRRLAEQAGLDPSAQLSALQSAILSDSPTLRRPPAMPRTAAPDRHPPGWTWPQEPTTEGTSPEQPRAEAATPRRAGPEGPTPPQTQAAPEGTEPVRARAKEPAPERARTGAAQAEAAAPARAWADAARVEQAGAGAAEAEQAARRPAQADGAAPGPVGAKRGVNQPTQAEAAASAPAWGGSARVEETGTRRAEAGAVEPEQGARRPAQVDGAAPEPARAEQGAPRSAQVGGVSPGPAGVERGVHQAARSGGAPGGWVWVDGGRVERAGFDGARGGWVRPAQLPVGPGAFAGREGEVDALRCGLLGGSDPVCVVTGAPGIGKTALALRVAHELRGEFPDGQLYVDLRGADPAGAADPAEVLAGFLRGLGIDGPAVPADPGERGALYRSLLADRRVLVLLDNAAGAEQVRPLLPGASSGPATTPHTATATGAALAEQAQTFLPGAGSGTGTATTTGTGTGAGTWAAVSEQVQALLPGGGASLGTATGTGAALAEQAQTLLPSAGATTGTGTHIGAALAEQARTLLPGGGAGLGAATGTGVAVAEEAQALLPGGGAGSAAATGTGTGTATGTGMGTAGAEEVPGLLAGAGAGAAVIVTSRHRLGGLERRVALGLPLLDEAASLALLALVAGPERVAAEPEAARELVRLCGRLPLALRVVGAELAALPHRELARLVARLTDERARLDVLDGVRAGLRLSYRALPADARALLRGLALLDAPDYAAWTAAAVLDRPLDTAEEALDALTSAHLLEVAGRDEAGRPRYRMHDLVRAFGRELAPRDEAVLRRVLACWVALVREGRRAHQGLDYPGLGGPTAARVPDPAVLAGPRGEPVRWLGAERDALVATVRQAARVDPYACRELAASAEYLFDLRSDLAGWQAVQETGLAAARAAGDRTGEAVLLVGLGRLRTCREEWGAAREMLGAGEALFEELGDAHGAAYAGWLLSYLDRTQGRLAEAERRCRRIAPVFEAAGDRYGQAHALRGTGQVLLARGETARALEVLREALAVAELGGAAWPRMCMLRWVADAQRMLGRLDEAEAGFREVLAFTVGSGDLAGQSAARIGLGRIAQDRGDTGGALRHLREADEAGRRSGQSLVRALAVPPLARALLASGDAPGARAVLEEALSSCRRMNARPLLAQLESALADVPG